MLLDQTELPVEFPLSGDLEAYVIFGVVKPKTSKRTSPRGTSTTTSRHSMCSTVSSGKTMTSW